MVGKKLGGWEAVSDTLIATTSPHQRFRRRLWFLYSVLVRFPPYLGWELAGCVRFVPGRH